MSQQSDVTDIKSATYLIKIISVVLAIMIMVISRYAFIFFMAAMLPSVFAIFFDRNNHKCLSATICTFNLIGVLPSLVQIWQSGAVDYVSKQLLADINTWMVIYGAAFIGQLLYSSLPLLIVRIYKARSQLRAQKLQQVRKIICDEWGI